MRIDGKPEGLRQSMSWLHTWSGLVLGWLLYAVFFTGTLSFFRDEIDDWMRPELHRSVASAETAQLGLDAMQKLAPNATTWTLSLPNARQTAIEASWREPGAAAGRAGTSRATLDAGTGERIEHRETRGGNFLYRFHFELYAMPRIWGRWIVGFATMLMFVAIISGVITHKKIFTDFFTFRPRKGQRSWLDAHNATAVLALPFHILITFSGLLLLMNLLMPWGIQAAYNGDTGAYFSEMRGNRQAAGGGQGAGGRAQAEPGQHAPLASIAPLLAQAQQQWPRHGVGSITVNAPGTARATIELREGGGSSLVNRGASSTLLFDGVSGASRQPHEALAVSWPRATSNVFTSLHLGRFAEPAVRWLLFLSGVVGTLMAATGMVLWVVKRLPERRKLGYTPKGHRFVEVLNVGSIAGLSVATAAYFWFNRLIPVELAGRGDWEIRGFFTVWLLCLLHPLLRAPRQAWREQMAVAALLFALLPVLNPLTGGASLAQSLAHSQWSIAGFDLMMMALAVIHGVIVWWLARPQAAARPAAKAGVRKSTGEQKSGVLATRESGTAAGTAAGVAGASMALEKST
ncbi:PepSY domain-containing protein [Diaphorobacter ruginosibacter]|uniref:PepSY domain-containing protein n=1 Tax=Diaphorobacter ruginosibacter TaxID=1715720 RepID=A0A7G9RNK8_9BURK|nr:PepSY-associated TM helix domain-containing protein [Diaphorobacter ruginosibacter]QNN57183.1 PepSY domain-containing protein [Diaphorobacter ruginosibacter]